MWLGAQGKAEQRLGGAERLGRAERRLGRAGEAAELCGAAELLGVPLTDASGNGGLRSENTGARMRGTGNGVRECKMGSKTRQGCGNEAAVGSKRAKTTGMSSVVLVETA